jgi:hypothetical protein
MSVQRTRTLPEKAKKVSEEASERMKVSFLRNNALQQQPLAIVIIYGVVTLRAGPIRAQFNRYLVANVRRCKTPGST